MRYVKAGIVGLGLLAAGCSSASTTAATSKEPTASASTVAKPSTSSLAAQLEAAAQPALAAASQAGSAVNNLPSTATVADVANAIKPLIAAAQTYETQVTDIAWPPFDTADAHALVTAIASYVGVLQQVGNQNGLSVQSWETQASSSLSAERAAANILRHDLGLPPESTNG
jgi:hypothetical protein